MEHEYKLTKIKAALMLYQNADQTMLVVREFKGTRGDFRSQFTATWRN